VSVDSRRSIFDKQVENVPAKISMSHADKEGEELVISVRRRNGSFEDLAWPGFTE